MSDYKMKVEVKNLSNNEIPKFETDGASGFDLRAFIKDGEGILIKPLERVLIPTGLYFNIPVGLEIQVRPRSGLVLKKGITVLNSPGTIDADYTGPVGIILINLSNEDFKVTNGDRIAQGVIQTVMGRNLINLELVDEIYKTTERGVDGFGSTGIK